MAGVGVIHWLQHREPWDTWYRRITQMRAIELIEMLIHDVYPPMPRGVPGLVRNSDEVMLALQHWSRDRLIAELLNARDQRAIEACDCPVCWCGSGNPCTTYESQYRVVECTDLIRVYHAQRRYRAEQKVGMRL